MQSLSQSITQWFRSLKRKPLNGNNACVKAQIETDDIDTTQDNLTVFGVRVQINADTQIEDGRISVNEFYVIDGFASNDGKTLIATGIERNHKAKDVEICGPVTKADASEGELEVMGVAVTSDEHTQFEDAQGNVVQGSLFFAAITTDISVVRANWSMASDSSLFLTKLILVDEFSSELLETTTGWLLEHANIGEKSMHSEENSKTVR